MKSIINYISPYFLIAVLIISLGACSRPVIKIENIPGNTPPGSNLYIAGNFNRWDPGDIRFSFDMDADSNYYFNLPRGFGNIEFKITRGEWSSVETDICGYDINNRVYDFRAGDTITINVLSWSDTDPINCPEVTIVLDNIPKNTPIDEPIALAGNFNEWVPDSSSYLHRDSGTGKYMIKLPRRGLDRLIEFKVTRGNLLTAEADKFGYEIEKRQLKFGLVDTLFIDVEAWEDIEEPSNDQLTIILNTIPKTTTDDDDIYLTGSFNGWYPKDNKYKFRKNPDGKYQFTLPKEGNSVEFKITRGDWSKEEVDVLGYKMNNRKFEFGSADTLFIDVRGWLDQSEIKQPTYTFVIDQVPETTPADDNLYLAGSINGWNSGNRKYRFDRAADGKYYLTIHDGWRALDYKITRGSWKSQEVDNAGRILDNRYFEFTGADTVHLTVKNWQDIPGIQQDKVVLVLEKVPENTPKDRNIFIAGNFNNWNPSDPDFILNKNLKNQYYITIPRQGNKIAFKFTLGSWDLEELNLNGNTIANREYTFGYADTLRLKVEKWEGLDW